MRVTHVITGLSAGGAEMALFKLLSQTDRTRFSPEVISLTNDDEIGERIRSIGISVRALGMRRGVSNPMFVARLARILKGTRPDVVHTWMYHADLMGGLSARLAGGTPVLWNVRHSDLDPRHTKRTTLWTAKACALLSGALPERIVCAAEASERAHAALGYDAKKMVVIPNGFDLSVFRPDPDARRAVRRELRVPPDTPLVGLVARFHPDKDHRNFVEAAGTLAARRPDVHFLLCGEGTTPENHELSRWIEASGVRDRCHLLGRRGDVPRITAALDVAALSSSSEAFPNVVGEAMACEVPCAVTDVGDSTSIVGDTGVVVPPKDPEALAGGLMKLLGMSPGERRAMGEKARKRVEERYSLRSVAASYEALYEELAGGARP